jgi:hypothetical protein
MGVVATVICAAQGVLCQAASNDTMAAVSVTAFNQATKNALVSKQPQIDLSTFYLQRVTHNLVLSPDAKTEMETFDLVYRLRPNHSHPTVLSKQEVVAIHVELDAQAVVRRLLLIPRDGKSTGAITVPLSPNEDATLVNEGVLPPKP